MQTGSPVFVRVFKEESELEIWKQRDDGRYYHFKTYPICNWSGEIGPKQSTGDKQAPEGFYTITPTLMNPNSTSAIQTPTTGRGAARAIPSWCTGIVAPPGATR